VANGFDFKQEPHWKKGKMPGRARIGNIISTAMSKRLKIHDSQLPRAAYSVLLLQNEHYPTTFNLVYRSAADAKLMRELLRKAAVSFIDFKPRMVKLEISGFNKQWTPEEINEWLDVEHIREKRGLRGLLCVHMLSSANGTAQFMLPSYLQDNIHKLPLPTDEYGSLVSSSRVPTKFSVLLHDPARRKLCQGCWQYVDIVVDGVPTHGAAGHDCPNKHKCGFCSAEGTCMDKCQNPGTFRCPHPDCSPEKNHSIYRCDKYKRKRVGLGKGVPQPAPRLHETHLRGASQEIKREAPELEAEGSENASDFPAFGREPTRLQQRNNAWSRTGKEDELAARVADLSAQLLEAKKLNDVKDRKISELESTIGSLKIAMQEVKAERDADRADLDRRLASFERGIDKKLRMLSGGSVDSWEDEVELAMSAFKPIQPRQELSSIPLLPQSRQSSPELDGKDKEEEDEEEEDQVEQKRNPNKKSISVSASLAPTITRRSSRHGGHASSLALDAAQRHGNTPSTQSSKIQASTQASNQASAPAKNLGSEAKENKRESAAAPPKNKRKNDQRKQEIQAPPANPANQLFIGLTENVIKGAMRRVDHKDPLTSDSALTIINESTKKINEQLMKSSVPFDSRTFSSLVVSHFRPVSNSLSQKFNACDEAIFNRVFSDLTNLNSSPLQ
jgi:hypothetical protein